MSIHKNGGLKISKKAHFLNITSQGFWNAKAEKSDHNCIFHLGGGGESKPRLT